SLTLLSRSMRSVQAIGGVCRSGASATTIVYHCPSGVAGTTTLSIFGGLLFLLLFVICAGETGRSLLLLAWSALFLTLGWDFLDYGFHLTSGSGTNGGFIVCAVLFIVMGAVPLFWLLPRLWSVITGTPDPSDAPGAPGHVPLVGATSVQFTPPPSSSPPAWGTGTSVRMASPPSNAPSTGKDVAGELERLASLHRRGELTDAEYEAAKAQAIANTGKPT
ncbi:MAG TPA: SHOCT domain-containing protein, partial [Acidimicrobiia bacterium]